MESEARRIHDVVVLLAGNGSRLRAGGQMLPKPLVPVCGRPLVSYIIEALARVGIRNLHMVVGAEGDALVRALHPLVPNSMQLNPINNPDWQKQNGLSVLCAAREVSAPFLLTMGDHLFELDLLEQLLRAASPEFLNVAIDRKLESIFDLDDAMKLQTRGPFVTAIGKDLKTYDAIDTGLFICPNELFDALQAAKKDGDCSLADGIRQMISSRAVRAIDIGSAWWQDVDTLAMLARAEEQLPDSLRFKLNPA
jgi:choline kinase